jgi:MOSC domain-containing protein YiiM
VRPVRAAPTDDDSSLASTLRACVASILELELEEVPQPHPANPLSLVRAWLGSRGLGLVPIADPQSFSFPGPWIALARGEAVVAFGPPPDIIWAPLGDEPNFAEVEAGWLIAPADVALWERRERSGPPRERGRVELITIAPAKEAPVTVVDSVQALAGRGLDGDRYESGAGTFSNPYGLGHQLTLVEAEEIEALELPSGRRLAPEQARRNIVTRGIDLNALVGRTFTVGGAECIGRRLCEPCAHLQRLTEPGILRGLVHRGGLRADILRSGRIAVGDEIRAG